MRRVGREKIIEGRRPLGVLDVNDGFRSTAAEHITIKLRTCDQLLCSLANRLEPSQAERERRRHVLGAGADDLFVVGNEQARLEKCQPGRHHQIVGCQFKSKPARFLNESQILIGKRQDRDLGNIDFLLPRQSQQQVEGSLETLHIHNEGRLVRGAISKRLRISRKLVGDHDSARESTGPEPDRNSRNAMRAAARSVASGGLRPARAAAAGRCASPSSTGTSAATDCISSARPLQWSTTSHPAAIDARTRAAIVPAIAPMEMSSVIKTPSKPTNPRITSRTIVAEIVAGATGSIAEDTIWAVMASGRWLSARNAAKSVSSSVARSAWTVGNPEWLSTVARPWPGICLTTGRTPPARNPSAIAPAIAATFGALSP